MLTPIERRMTLDALGNGPGVIALRRMRENFEALRKNASELDREAVAAVGIAIEKLEQDRRILEGLW